MNSGSASGRLDLLGGVADYSGALVLELPTCCTTTVTAEPADGLQIGGRTFTPADLAELAELPYPAVRDRLRDSPRTTRYLAGVAIVLVRHGIIEPPRARLTISSSVPQSVGVSSSAALEIATARALGADIDPLHLAALCQQAENHVVGAPCGIMDQVTVAAGVPGAILPILCRPAQVHPPLAVPTGYEVVGVPTGAEHDVSGVPYRRARAAAFMGKRMVESAVGRTWSWISELPPPAVGDLPDAIGGAAFLDRWGGTDDDLTTVDPEETYPVRAATAFGVEEHERAQRAVSILASGDVAGLGQLLGASHAGYDAMGLGHPAATSTRGDLVGRAEVIGARSSGGGSGGTIVALCRRGGLDDVEGLVR
jgi:galactokinase